MMEQDGLGRINATAVFYSDDCIDEIRKQESIDQSYFFCPVSKINEQLLNDIYLAIYEKEKAKNNTDYRLLNPERRFLLKDEKVKITSALFYASQYGKLQDLYQRAYQSTDIEILLYTVIFKSKTHNDVLCSLSHRDDIDRIKEDESYYDRTYDEEKKIVEVFQTCNVVITAPGVPRQQIRRGNLSPTMPDNERHALRLMGIHRAIAENAALIEMPLLPYEYFDALNQLEIACKDGTNNSFVWRKLRELGNIVDKMLNERQRIILSRAKHISVFSNAPIGLGILPGTKAPFHNIREVSYHSLTPMGRTFPMEMSRRPSIYFKHRFKLLFAECIPNTDENIGVLACSYAIIQKLKEYEEEYENFEFISKETLSIADFKAFIDAHHDASAIIISAHGNYQTASNMSCIMIGDEPWMADDIDWIPPLVLLSSCHTAPRGSGCVTVADMFLRIGAIAVLAASVPVNAHRNSILFTRLILYILEAQKGSRQYNNMSDLWTGVASGNTIHEIIQASDGLRTWIYEKNADGVLRLEDFELNRVNKKGIRPAFIYEDTIKVLKEMLEDNGKSGKCDAILDHENYFPEASFYQFLGAPENILVYNEVFDIVGDSP